MFKKIIAMTIALSISTSVAAASPSIEYLQDKRILIGDDDGDLHLDENLTRAEAVILAMRSTGFNDSKWYREDIEKFADMPMSHWASGYVYKAVSQNIIDGDDGKFKPDESLTVEHWCKILVELAGYSDLEYPQGYIKKAEELGILTEEIPKSGEITREIAALMLYNLLTMEGSEIVPTVEPKPETSWGVSSGGGSSSASTSTNTSTSVGGGAAPAPPVSDASTSVSGVTVIPNEQIPNPEAGQITAGEWNDNDNYEYWQELMTNNDLYRYVAKWSHNANRFIVNVSNDGYPLRDANVTVSDADGNKIWNSVTNKDGKGYIFIDNLNSQQQGYIITVQSGDETYSEEYLPNPEEPLTIELTGREPEDIVDIMFMIDTTGSMGDELQYIKSELKDVISRVDSNVRISCNYYRDHEDQYVVKPYDFTTEIDNVMEQITNQNAMGGGDYPEAVDEALYNAVYEHDWSPSARARLLFLVLDAPPHDTEENIESIRETIKTAAQKGIRIVPIASSGVNKETEFLLRSIALETGGRYVFLTDDSGIGNSHIEADVGDFVVEYLNEMIIRIINEYV